MVNYSDPDKGKPQGTSGADPTLFTSRLDRIVDALTGIVSLDKLKILAGSIINGATIDNSPVGQDIASTGRFTSLEAETYGSDGVSDESINHLKGLTTPASKLNYTNDVTGDIQAQFNTNNLAISNLQSTANNLQSQISSNDDDITALQTTTTGLQNQVNSNDSDISSLQTTTTSLQNQVNSNDTDISSLQTDTTSLQNQVNNNDTDISNLQNQKANGSGLNGTFVFHAGAATGYYTVIISNGVVTSCVFTSTDSA